MKTLIRKTLTGTEFWDSKEKRTVFVPKGKKPDFEVTDNPGSMITKVGKAIQKDKTGAINPINLLGLNAEQMINIAKEHGIEVPGNMKKPETIQKYIEEELAAAADASDKE